ncbi:MAG: hypothetical protein ABI977_07655 [Acidobacteriota bacterium]
MNFSKIPSHQNKKQDAAEREFDEYLHEIDDYLGDAPGITVSPDFVPRVMERARAEMRPAAQAATQGWSIQRWFTDFSLGTRMAIATAVMLAAFGGFRAGRVMTEVIGSRNAPPQAEVIDPLGMAAPEMAIVQLMHGDGLTPHSQPNRTGGEER